MEEKSVSLKLSEKERESRYNLRFDSRKHSEKKLNQIKMVKGDTYPVPREAHGPAWSRCSATWDMLNDDRTDSKYIPSDSFVSAANEAIQINDKSFNHDQSFNHFQSPHSNPREHCDSIRHSSLQTSSHDSRDSEAPRDSLGNSDSVNKCNTKNDISNNEHPTAIKDNIGEELNEAKQNFTSNSSRHLPLCKSLSDSTSKTSRAVSPRAVSPTFNTNIATSGMGHGKVKKYLQLRWQKYSTSSSPDPENNACQNQSMEITDADSSDLRQTARVTVEHSEFKQEVNRAEHWSLSESSRLSCDTSQAGGGDAPEISPSAYIRATRIYDDVEVTYRDRWMGEERGGEKSYIDTRIKSDFSTHERYYDNKEGRSFMISERDYIGQPSSLDYKPHPCYNSRTSIPRESSPHSELHAQSVVYSKYQNIVPNKDQLISSAPQNLDFHTAGYPASPPTSFIAPFHAPPPVFHSPKRQAGSTPPSPLVSSHQVIRRYNSLGSSVSPTCANIKQERESPPRLHQSHSDYQLRGSPTDQLSHGSPNDPLRGSHSHGPIDSHHIPMGHTYLHSLPQIKKSFSPNPTTSERTHKPARRIHSLGSYFDNHTPLTTPSPVHPLSPLSPLKSPTHRRNSRFLQTSPFTGRQRDSYFISPTREFPLQHSVPLLYPCFVCPVCGAIFQSYPAVSSHMSVHVNDTLKHEIKDVTRIEETEQYMDRNYSGLHIDKLSPNKETSHERMLATRTHVDEKHDSIFDSRSHLNQQDYKISSNVPESITLSRSPVADQQPSPKSSGVIAAADSSGLNPQHLCRVCNRSFSRSDMLSRHMRLHTGHRPYECLLCGQVFSRSDHLHTHQRTHTGEKPYHCRLCSYSASRRDMVTRHMRVHTRDSATGRGRRAHPRHQAPRGPVRPVETRPRHLRESDHDLTPEYRNSEVKLEMKSPPHHMTPEMPLKGNMGVVSEMSLKGNMGVVSEMSLKGNMGVVSPGSFNRVMPDRLSIKPNLGSDSSLHLSFKSGDVTSSWPGSLSSYSLSPASGLEVKPSIRLEGGSSPTADSPAAHPPTPRRGRPSSSRTLSEISEYFPSPGYAGPTPTFWSPCTDSPGDVFTPSVKHQVKYFIWPPVVDRESEKGSPKMDTNEIQT